MPRLFFLRPDVAIIHTMVRSVILALVSLGAGLVSRAVESVEKPAVERWNEGVELYRSGDTNGAYEVMNDLYTGLDPVYRAKAAEVIAKLRHEASRDPENKEALAALEEAALAAQVALRANPGDARAERNFTRATDGLLGMRDAKRVNDILAKNQNADPGSLLRTSRDEARALMDESAGLLTNRADVAVAKSDSLSARAEKLDETWILAREAIVQSVTNEEQAATIQTRIDAARNRTAEAARRFGELDADGYSSIADAEKDFNDFFKMMAMPRPAMEEDLVTQSNAWIDVEKINERPWQREALDYTRRFRSVFPAWARQYEQAAQADTNKPPFTAEAQAKVAALATELEKQQLSTLEKPLPPAQEKALQLIAEIRELLPKDPNGGGGQGQPNQQPNQDPQQKQNPPNKDQPQQEPQEQPQNQPPDQKQDQDPQENQAPDESDEPQDEEKSKEEQELEATLKKAQERNDEHEADKKARMRKAPLPPNERDW